jgi:hypothetical protein
MKLPTSRSLFTALMVVGVIAPVIPSQAQKQTTKDQLVGTWKISFLKTTGDNQVSYPLGENPSGFVGISANRVWLMLVDSLRKSPAAATMTDEEAASQMKSHAAWTGKYDADATQTPDGIKITIHVDAASSQPIYGTNRMFYMRVDGNKLTWKSPAAVVPMTGKTSVVQVEFTKAD